MIYVLVAVIGLGGGVLAGLFGVGGGIVFVPTLALGLGLTQLHAHLFWRSRPGLVVPDTQPVAFHMPLYREGRTGPPDRPAATTRLRLA